MKTFQSFLLSAFVIITSTSCLAQGQQDYVLKPGTPPPSAPPPTDALAVFKPYLGFYEFGGDFSGETYQGTLEVKPAVNGWYVEWIITINAGDQHRTYDRQLRMLTTWDRFAEQYRIWRFETNSPHVLGEGKARFEGDEFIMEWRMPAPDGEMGTFRNRVTLTQANEVVIVSEGDRDSGGTERIGVGTAKRRL